MPNTDSTDTADEDSGDSREPDVVKNGSPAPTAGSPTERSKERESLHDSGGEPGQGEEVPYLLELYKFAVEMADRVSGRRAASNSFFLAVNGALTAFVGLIDTSAAAKRVAAAHLDHFGATVITLVGIVFSATWWLLLRSYRDLSRAKWEVITRLENRLDIRLYQDEWKILTAEQPTTWRRRYRELGLVERVVPLLFLGVYITFAIRAIV